MTVMKFYSLFRKELKEMLSVQTLVTLVFSVVLLVFAGHALSDAISDTAKESQTITICDMDKTDFTSAIIDGIKSLDDAKVKMVSVENDNYSKELDRLDVKSVVIIPKGFTDQFLQKKTADVQFVQRMTSLAQMSNITVGSDAALEMINQSITSTVYANKMLDGTMTADEIKQLNNPVKVHETTVVSDKQESVNSSILAQLCSTQGMVIPIVMFILIMYSSQMILNAISTEKLDKTLETLLSAPVSRISVLSAKMLSAGIVAALQAVVYMFGMNQMMSGMTGGSMGDTKEYTAAMDSLGLTMSAGQYALVGVQMFLSILIALSVSMVLGALVKDAKSAQTLILPITLSAMIPYMLSMFVDIKTATPVLRYIVYAIPFSHTFMASENVIFKNYSLYLGGVAYQLIFLAVCMTFALKVFMSDRIFTMSIGGKQKKKGGLAAMFAKK